MFEWLNRNAAAVQALAAILSVLATIGLLYITNKYVALTQELARAAREQLRFQQRTVASEAAQLVTLVDVFLAMLKRLPLGQRDDREALRGLSLWKHGDVSSFASLAAVVVGTKPEVQHAIQRLNWLRATVERVQQTQGDETNGRDHLSWDEWNRQLGEAKTALQTVRADARAAEPQADASVESHDAESQKP